MEDAVITRLERKQEVLEIAVRVAAEDRQRTKDQLGASEQMAGLGLYRGSSTNRVCSANEDPPLDPHFRT